MPEQHIKILRDVDKLVHRLEKDWDIVNSAAKPKSGLLRAFVFGIECIYPKSLPGFNSGIYDTLGRYIKPGESEQEVIYETTGLLYGVDLSGYDYSQIEAQFIVNCNLSKVKGTIPERDFHVSSLRIIDCKLPAVDFSKVDNIHDYVLLGNDLSRCILIPRQVLHSRDFFRGLNLTIALSSPPTVFPKGELSMQDMPANLSKKARFPSADLRYLTSLDICLFLNRKSNQIYFPPPNCLINTHRYMRGENLSLAFSEASLLNWYTLIENHDFLPELLVNCGYLKNVELDVKFPKPFFKQGEPIAYHYENVDMSKVENFPSDIFFASSRTRFINVKFPEGADLVSVNLHLLKECSCAGPIYISEHYFEDMDLLRKAFGVMERLNVAQDALLGLSEFALLQIYNTHIHVEGILGRKFIEDNANDNSPLGLKLKKVLLTQI